MYTVSTDVLPARFFSPLQPSLDSTNISKPYLANRFCLTNEQLFIFIIREEDYLCFNRLLLFIYMK